MFASENQPFHVSILAIDFFIEYAVHSLSGDSVSKFTESQDPIDSIYKGL
jgi:hypothetical protein